MTHLILIEDDERMGQLLVRFLEGQGYRVQWEQDGARYGEILSAQPDLVVLDLMLPSYSGLEICKRVRPNYAGPILMLTASNDDVNEIKALDLGIDDYLTKPFRAHVLAARIRALLRRAGGDKADAASESRQLIVGDLRLDPGDRTVKLAETPVAMTESEFELLWRLAAKAGEVVTRESLYGALKGSQYQGFDRAIDMRISALRKKLNDPAPYQRIKTVRGKGYLYSKGGHA